MKYTSLLILMTALLGSTPVPAAIETEGDWGKLQFYGSLRVLLTYEDKRDADIADGVSRIGIQGYVNLTDTWQGTYRLEGRVLMDTGALLSDESDIHKRVSYAGIKSAAFGELRLGKQFSPHYLWTILPIDITLHNPRHYNIRWNASENSSIREANSIAYFSPAFAGFSLGVLAEVDQADKESSGADAYNLAAKYVKGPWQLGLSYFDRSDDSRVNDAQKPDAKTFGAALQYRQGVHKVVLRYQDEDISDGSKFTTTGGYYAYRFGGDSGLEMQTRIYNLDNGLIDGNQAAIGLTHKFGKAGQLFVEYVDYDKEAALLKGRDDDLTLGVRVDF